VVAEYCLRVRECSGCPIEIESRTRDSRARLVEGGARALACARCGCECNQRLWIRYTDTRSNHEKVNRLSYRIPRAMRPPVHGGGG